MAHWPLAARVVQLVLQRDNGHSLALRALRQRMRRVRTAFLLAGA